MTGKILKTLAVCGTAALANGSDMIHFQQGAPTTATKGNISFWSQKPGGKIEFIKDSDGTRVAKLTGNNTDSYLTPMINLKPVKVNNKTVLSFQLKCPVTSLYKINLTNGVENAWYRLCFEAKANQWVTFRQYLSGASFSRNLSKDKVINDGMLGDTLTCVQIEAKGKKVLLKNFRIYESEKTVGELPLVKPITRAGYKLHQYPQFERGGFFPFGVISTVKAGNEKNGKYFSQSLEERRKMDLLTIRRLNFNTYCNFSDDTLDVEGRLKAMRAFDLYLMETAPAYLDYIGNAEKTRQIVKKFNSDNRLIAWYGRDEPADFEKYIDWKMMVNKYSPNRPFTSALDNPYKIKVLGKLMEIIMPDVYPLTVATRTPAHDIVTKTGAQIRLSRACCGNGKVWSINQAYSLRREQNKESFYLLRYPNPVEIRFDFFNSLAAGSEGIIYFILNDEVPFFDSKIRREEFDRTLIDPWYNNNSTGLELSTLGRDVVPVAASIMGAREIEPYNYSETEKIVRRTTQNEFGRYYYIVNADLTRPAIIKFNPALEQGWGCVDLISSEKLSVNQVKLAPGAGTILMAGKPENTDKITTEIKAQKIHNALNLAELENKIIAQAGQPQLPLDKDKISADIKQKRWAAANAELDKFFTNLKKFYAGKSDYAATGRKLIKVRKIFGQIYEILIQPRHIDKYDGKNNPEYEGIFNELKELSQKYFAMYRDWESGRGVQTSKLENLKAGAEKLLNQLKLN